MTKLSGFLQAFELDEGAETFAVEPVLSAAPTAAEAILTAIGGRSFNLGTFRTFTLDSAKEWNAIIGGIFPAFRDVIMCTGYGWDGRIVAETLAEREDIERGVAVFVPGTADCLNAPIDIVSFLNDVLSDADEDILDEGTYLEWLKVNGAPVQYDECVGYDVPLFLDGEPSSDNMNVTDLRVYWDVNGDLIKAYLDADDDDPFAVQ